MALEASAAGKLITKSPELEALSVLKFKTITEVSPEVSSLNINAPRAVIVLLEKVVSAKSKNAVVPEDAGFAAIVKVFQPAVYPVPLTSLVVEYEVVVASKVALEVNKASLNVCDVSALKSISPFRRATLNDVHNV